MKISISYILIGFEEIPSDLEVTICDLQVTSVIYYLASVYPFNFIIGDIYSFSQRFFKILLTTNSHSSILEVTNCDLQNTY
jgi:hypothetical protein